MIKDIRYILRKEKGTLKPVAELQKLVVKPNSKEEWQDVETVEE